MEQISLEQIYLFRSLFKARTDVYARFWADPAANKSGYAPVYRLSYRQDALNDQVILSHLSGKELIGIYPLLSDNTTYFLAIDFDKDNWLENATQLIKMAELHKLPCYLELSKSGNGGHVWFFFSKNVPAFKARQLGKYLLSKIGTVLY